MTGQRAREDRRFRDLTRHEKKKKKKKRNTERSLSHIHIPRQEACAQQRFRRRSDAGKSSRGPFSKGWIATRVKERLITSACVS